MEERQQPSNLKDCRKRVGFDALRGAFARIGSGTGLAALTSILLVTIGIGTSRGSNGAASGIAGAAGADVRAEGSSGTLAAPGLGAGLVGRGVLPGNQSIAPRGAADARRSLLALLVPDRFGCSTALEAPDLPPDPADMRTYNGRPVRIVAVLRMKVTAYSPDERSCGSSADGITASGYSVLTNGGFLVAADPRVLPLGSLLSIPGYDDGAVVPVLDTGGAIKGNRLDVLYPTHELAVEWGVQELDVEVWEYADGLPSGFRRVRRPAK